MPRKALEHCGSLGGTLVAYTGYFRKPLSQFRQQKPGPGVLGRENDDSEKNEQDALQEWQNQSDDAQQDETPACDEDQKSLDVWLHGKQISANKVSG